MAPRLLTPSATSREQSAGRVAPVDWRELFFRLSGIDVRVCPACTKTAVVRTALPAARSRAPPVAV
ncbi:MAG: hypothetical protein ACLQVI_04425 [Polyangiaceae bacterium]